jgi:putative molybdopterin biosynthesis protein
VLVPREQEQFLKVVDRDLAERRWWDAVRPSPLGKERIPLAEALGRVLAEEVAAGVDVPPYDRSNLDGYAVQSADTIGASDETPRRLRLLEEELATGIVPGEEVRPGTAAVIATGAMLPRGADAVVMVEQTRLEPGGQVAVLRSAAPGQGLSSAGSDIARGERVLRAGTELSARETGVLAAIGRGEVVVWRRPRVAIVSTGNEIVAPGEPLRPGCIFDSNATILADSVREAGGIPLMLGIVPDDAAALAAMLERAVAAADLVLLSGGTSKGGGDLSYQVLATREPGIVVHGVALKPGKPLCLGAVGRRPVAVLPGFPTSAVFTFHELVAPLVRMLGGRSSERAESLEATLSLRLNSEPGRTEYALVSLVPGTVGWTAYPMGKGSGSVTAFSLADGFVTIARDQEHLEAGERVRVTPLGRGIRPVDLVVMGSHCLGLDLVLSELARRGLRTKTFWVGSQGGLIAAERGECDVAGTHLLDPASGVYNRPFLPPGVRLHRGYRRMQGIVFRRDDARLAAITTSGTAGPDRSALLAALLSPGVAMIHRNRGSGTRILIDGLVDTRRPPGYRVEARSHNAVAAAVAQGRADWGVAIAPVAALYGLGFVPLAAEEYDLAIPESRWERPAVAMLREALAEPSIRARLEALGFPRIPEVPS